jgi:putative phage-type endonuclease
MNFSKKKNNSPPLIHGFQDLMSEEDWLAWRRSGIGGSDAGVAVGWNPYKSPLDLYLDKKTGRTDFVGNTATEWGHRLEPFVIEACRQKHPEICKVLVDLPLMSHPDRTWQLATMDKGIAEGKFGPGGIEAKTALSFFTGKSYQDGNVPNHHRAQCLHYMSVTGAPFWILAAFTEGPRFYTHIIERDEAEIEWLNEKETLLWNAIQDDDIEYLLAGCDKTSKALLKLYPEVLEEDPVFLTDQKVLDAVETYVFSKKIERAAGEDKREAANTIKAALGPCESAYIGRHLVKWQETKNGRRFSIKEDPNAPNKEK